MNEQMLLIKRLSFLMRSGMPILMCITVLRDQVESKRSVQIFETIMSDISNGRSLATSMSKFPRVFDTFSVHIIEMGERSGTLAESLAYLADELKKKQQLKRKIIGAFMYPAIITIAACAITLFLILYLFPKIMPVFTSLGMELPLATRVVIWVSTMLMHWGLLLVAGFMIVWFGFFMVLKKNARLRTLLDRTYMYLPIIGTCLRTYQLASSSRTLGLLLKTGMPLSDALACVAEITTHQIYKRAWHDLAQAVYCGGSIATLLQSQRDCFPIDTAHMISVGERSGTLAETWTYLSELYEADLDEITKNLSNLIEPVLMLTMGLVIGFIALSIILPIYGITQNLHG